MMHQRINIACMFFVIGLCSFSANGDPTNSSESQSTGHQVYVTGLWKVQSIHHRPNIEPDELYELGGYLHYVNTNRFVLTFADEPMDYLNDVWAERIDQAIKLEQEQKSQNQMNEYFPSPFQSITFGFDYWIQFWNQSVNGSAHDDQQVIAKNTCNLTLSICNQMHEEFMIPNQWMYAAVRLNLDMFEFRQSDSLKKCIQRVYAKIQCYQIHHSGLIDTINIYNLAIKNVQLIYEYMGETDTMYNDSVLGNQTTFKSLIKKLKIKHKRRLLRKVGKTLVKQIVLPKLNWQVNHPMDLMFNCEYELCSSFQINDNAINADHWQGMQWAPFIPEVIEEYIGTDQNNVSHAITLVLDKPQTKCVSFKYYAGLFSRIHVSIQDVPNSALILYPTIKDNNKDGRNWALDWYENEICLADILKPDSFEWIRAGGGHDGDQIQTYQLIFTSDQPVSGGYVAISDFQLLEDFQRSLTNVNNQVLTGWTVDGAGAAEQWTSSPADNRWLQPQLSSINHLSILITKPQLIGSSAFSLLSTWFTRHSGQTLRFKLFNNFTKGEIEVQLLDVNYSVVWTSNQKRLWVGEHSFWSFDLDRLCPLANDTIASNANGSHVNAHLRWRINVLYANLNDHQTANEIIEVTALDQSDACSLPDACLHGSICRSIGVNRRQCICTNGYHGEQCEYRNQCILPLPGQKSGKEQCEQMNAFACIPVGSDFRCKCNSFPVESDKSMTSDRLNQTYENIKMWSDNLRECVPVNDCSRIQCDHPLHQCVIKQGNAVCECLPGYQAIVNNEGIELCSPMDTCSDYTCPDGAKCVDTSGQIMSTRVHESRICYCDVKDGLRPVADNNKHGFKCEPLFHNPFIKQAYKCYMDYGIPAQTSVSQLPANRVKRRILDGKEERAFDFNRDDSGGIIMIKEEPSGPLPSLSTEPEVTGSPIECKCLQGYQQIDNICVPKSDFESIYCQPNCRSNELCIQSNVSTSKLVGQCQCQIGFHGDNCEHNYCDLPESESELNHFCGKLGCQIGISANELNWFHCNCQAAVPDSMDSFVDDNTIVVKPMGGYRTHPVSGLCMQTNICSTGSAEKMKCDQINAVCVPNQSKKNGALFATCVCPLGYGWHLFDNRCVSLCDLDTHCGPLNAVCRLVPDHNTTECTCPVGRRWDPLRSSCILGDHKGHLYEMTVEFQLTTDQFNTYLYDQTTSPVSSVDCQINLDPAGCARQLYVARRRLVSTLHESLPLIHLLNLELTVNWIKSLKRLFSYDIQHVTLTDVQIKSDNQIAYQSAFENEYDLFKPQVSSALPADVDLPELSFHYRTLIATLLIDTNGLINWIESNELNASCIPLKSNTGDHNQFKVNSTYGTNGTNETNRTDATVQSKFKWCALPPQILVDVGSLQISQVDLCNKAVQLNMCPDNTIVQCSSDRKAFGCYCKPGYHSVLRIPQEVDGTLLIHFCEDTNECDLADTCDSSKSECINLPGSYRCDCLAGFKALNSTFCTDACDNVDCGVGTCTKMANTSFTHCDCPDGYRGFRCDQSISSINQNVIYAMIILFIILLLIIICLVLKFVKKIGQTFKNAL